MEINENTRVYDIIKEYGDIAEVMEVFGVKRVGPFSVRRIITRFLTVRNAARFHKVPLDEFLHMLNQAIESHEKGA